MEDTTGETEHGPKHARHGKAAGIPYDWRKPTAAKFKHAYWDTSTRKVFVPKVFGWGLEVNFGGLARRLHLVSAPPGSK